MAAVFYVDNTRTKVDPTTSVPITGTATSGTATTTVYRIAVGDSGNQQTSLWALAGTAVTKTKRDAAAAEASAATLPAPIPPATPGTYK